jgi:Holliday junction resolvasome RuvABC endonuclease subunit
MAIILGFDCSSTTIGFAILQWNVITNNISLVKTGYLKPIKIGSIIERIVHTRDQVLQIIKESQPDYIAIEEIIAFMRGKSTAKTIIMLVTFNRMVSLACYDFMGSAPHMYNVMTIRHGLKISKPLPKKEEMPNLISHHLQVPFPYEYGKKGKVLPENLDKADACAVALYQAFILSGKIKPKTKKPKKDKKHAIK